jgi:hypothetical protein
MDCTDSIQRSGVTFIDAGQIYPEFPLLQDRNKRNLKREAPEDSQCGCIFFVEKSSPKELAENILEFVELIQGEIPEVIQLITDWFLSTQNIKIAKKKIKSLHDLTEVTTMWATAVKEHDTNVKISNEQQILADVIEIKFGLPAQAKKKILSSTNSQKLRNGIKAVVTASTRQEVLKCLD